MNMKQWGSAWLTIALALLSMWAYAAEKTTYYVTNAQGTVVATMDSQSNVTYTATYRPYGKQQLGTPQAGPGYTGHVNDPDTGFVYMQARYYDPSVGRFLSIDPVVPKSGNLFNFNRYDYTDNNPVLNTDPDGRNLTAFIGGLFVESWSGLTGHGFHGSNLGGALKDGYNGKDGGVLHAALQDAGTITTVAGAAGILKGGVTLIASRIAAKKVAEEGVELAGEAAKKGLGNPFKNKTANEIDEMFTKKGFTKSGPDPAGGSGGYVNPKTGRSYHIDPEGWGKYREPNHVDVNRPRGYKGLPKKKLPYKED